jgi:hypothetical protein
VYCSCLSSSCRNDFESWWNIGTLGIESAAHSSPRIYLQLSEWPEVLDYGSKLNRNYTIYECLCTSVFAYNPAEPMSAVPKPL